MALDRITKKNYLSKVGPQIPVYSGWYNVVVDTLNNLTSEGLTVEDGGLVTSYSGQIPRIPLVSPPSLMHYFFDDFTLSAASAVPLATWTVTEDDAADTQLLIDVAGGALQLTCKAATDNDGQQIQLQQETFRLATGKELWFEARIRLPNADVTNIDVAIGLAVTEDITGVGDNMPANGIVFKKTDDLVGTVFLASSDNNVDIVSAASLKTIVTNTWTRLGFYFDGGATGLATITPYIDGVAGVPITAITYATMSELAPIAMVRNGDGTTTQVLDIDYIFVAQER